MSFDLILPFLRPMEHLIRDPEVSEIMVNGSSRVFTERQGKIEPVPGIELNEKSLHVALRNIARLLGDDISESKPILDARLPDGSRVAAVIPLHPVVWEGLLSLFASLRADTSLWKI